MDREVFYVLLAVMVFNSLWNTTSVALTATNRHEKFGHLYFIANFMMFPLSYTFTLYFGLLGTAITLLIVDMVLASYGLRTSLRLLNDHWNDFIPVILKPPFFLLKRLSLGS